MPELTPFVEDANEFWGDRLSVKDFIGKPAIVYVREVREGLTTSFNEAGDGRAVLVDVVDLTDGNIYINVAWWTGAVVDGLRKYVGQVTAIKFLPVQGKRGTYPKPASLEGQELQYAQSWLSHNPSSVDMLRKQREATEEAHSNIGVPDGPSLPTLNQPLNTPPPIGSLGAQAKADVTAPGLPLPENMDPAQKQQLEALLAAYQNQQK